MKPSFTLAGSIAASLALGACGKSPEPSNDSTPTPAASSAPAASSTPRPSGPLSSVAHPDLLDPSKASEKAPDVFKAKFATTKGDFVVEVHRDWSPSGADRFYNLVRMGFYDDTRFFRAVNGFMVQFGISGDPAVTRKWTTATIPDDPVKQSNKAGYVTFAKTGMPNSRTTQIFVNTVDNGRLDAMGFAPFAQVVQGLEIVNALYNGYGEGLNQSAIQTQGNEYLDTKYPKLDSVRHAEILK
jgi:peptidyl-prolyl cis-trans isomerase A (cyclophilin A)